MQRPNSSASGQGASGPPSWRLPPFGRPLPKQQRYQIPKSSGGEDKTDAPTAKVDAPSGASPEKDGALPVMKEPKRPISLSLVKALTNSPRQFEGLCDGDDKQDSKAGSGQSTPRSSCSTGSTPSTRTGNATSNAPSTRNSTSSAGSGGKGSSPSASRQNSKSMYLTFEDCSIDIEHEQGSSSSLNVVKDFEQIFKRCASADGILQCIRLYGFEKPLKLQMHAIPAIMNAFGSNIDSGVAFNKGKSCVLIQGPSRIGKTSSLALALLAAIDTSVPHAQAIVLTTSNRRDFDKYFNIFTLMHPVASQSFMGDDEHLDDVQSEFSEKHPSIQAALSAQILVGHPSRLLRLIGNVSNLRLDFVRLLIIDDAEELIFDAQNLGKSPTSNCTRSSGSDTDSKSTSSASQLSVPTSSVISMPKLTGTNYSTNYSSSSSSCAPTSAASAASSSAQNSSSNRTLIDDVIQICHVLECRQYSGQHMDTVHMASGGMVPQLRYVIMSQQVIDKASRKVLRLLKNSLMKKKNLLSPEGCTLPTRVMRKLKHYYVEAPRGEWVGILAGLVHSLMFPRAIVFADGKTERLEGFLKDMHRQKLAVSENVAAPVAGPSICSQMQSTMQSRRAAVQEFAAGKTQLLFVTSDPALCQIVLPKVSCVFHFDVPSDMLSVYGVRLLPLDARQPLDAVSVLFAENASSKIHELEKLFSIQFMDMPFEFIPSSPPNSPVLPKPRSGFSARADSPNSPKSPLVRKRIGKNTSNMKEFTSNHGNQ